MARISPFVVKFFMVFLLLLGGLGYGAYHYYGAVLTKSFYYKFSDAEMLSELIGAEMDRNGTDVKIAFPERDSVWHFPAYNKKNPAKSRFTLLDNEGNELLSDQAFKELPDYLQQVFRRLGETGVRRIRTEDGAMLFNIADRNRLVYLAKGGVSTMQQLPFIEAETKATVLDDHWFSFQLAK